MCKCGALAEGNPPCASDFSLYSCLLLRVPILPPLCKGVSRALCASPRCGVRAWRTEVFAIAGKNRDRWWRRSLLAPPRPWQALAEGKTEGLSNPTMQRKSVVFLAAWLVACSKLYLNVSFRPTRGEMPACRSISTKRRTSPIGAKSAKRGIPLQGTGCNK